MLWSITPQAMAEADLPHTGWAMARSLARAIPATPARLKEVEEAGVALGPELVDEHRSGALAGGADAVGQRARRTRLRAAPPGDDAVTRYELQACPYAEAVRENPAVVCTLHRGVVRGVLERLRPGRGAHGFAPRPPDIAGCIVEVHRAYEDPPA